MKKLNENEAIVLLVSVTSAILDSAVRRRVNALGGWEAAKQQQGIIRIVDSAVEGFQEAEEILFMALCRAEKVITKTIPKAATVSRTQQYLNDNNIYFYAGQVVDEIDRLIKSYTLNQPDVTYNTGYLKALSDIEGLMLTGKLSRVKALARLRKRTTSMRDVRLTKKPKGYDYV